MNGFSKHGITHLSASSLNLWINSPAMWVAEKIFGHRGAPSAAMFRGIAVEDAVVDTLRGADAAEAIRKAESGFDGRFFMGDEKTAKERAFIAPMTEQALAVLSPLGEPDFPEDGQHKIELVCNCGDFKLPIIGFLDLFYPQHGRVIDIKSTLRMPSKMSVDHQLQRAVYARAMGNSTVEFLYCSPSKSALLADGDVATILARVKAHTTRLEAFLSLLTKEQMRAAVPLNEGSFYWAGNEAIAKELYNV